MKIFCIGRNYAAHAKEMKSDIPTSPVIFMKPSTALLKDGKPFYYPEFSKDIHYEAEIVLKISKNGKHISEKFASQYYEEITIGIDFTARDLQLQCKEKSLPWEISKSFDHSAVIGDFVRSSDQNLGNLKFHLDINNKPVQKGTTADLIFSFNTLISYISKFFTLNKGDLIYTGTPAGVGPVQIGDKLTGYIGNDVLLQCEIK